jgi:hypothetical protein
MKLNGCVEGESEAEESCVQRGIQNGEQKDRSKLGRKGQHLLPKLWTNLFILFLQHEYIVPKFVIQICFTLR